MQLERDKATQDRHLETTRKELEAATTKRTELEHLASNQKAELIKLKDRNVKLDRELNKALDNLKAREWEVKQLKSRQDKTIVEVVHEHVHVLEEAKRVTDGQLKEAQDELQRNAAYIRSLENAKNRLAGEAEDLNRATEKERLELRTKEKNVRAQEERLTRALVEVEKERHAKDVAELQTRRVQNDLQHVQAQAEDLSQQLLNVQRAKDNLETELARLADETGSPSLPKMERQYQSRIEQLENELADTKASQVTASRIKAQVQKQHAEIRNLIMNAGPADDSFHTRLLRELHLADESLASEMSQRSNHDGGSSRTMNNVSPSKRTSDAHRVRTTSKPEPPRASDRQVNALKQHVQVLELQMAASERVRQHLETSIREITADLENSDGSKQSLQQHRQRLAKENGRLNDLLKDEAEARRAAASAQVDGVQSMFNKFQSTMNEERASYSRLEESRKALVSGFCGCTILNN